MASRHSLVLSCARGREQREESRGKRAEGREQRAESRERERERERERDHLSSLIWALFLQQKLLILLQSAPERSRRTFYDWTE